MKRHILIAGLFALTTATAALADPSDMSKYHERHMERMASELELTAEQQAKLSAVHEDHFDRMKTLHQEKQEQVNAILTAEQRQKWEQLREQRRDEMKKHMKDRKNGKHHKHGDSDGDAATQ